MIVGACAGSTSGGLKLMRVKLALKVAWREIGRIAQPKRIFRIRMNNEVVESDIQKNLKIIDLTGAGDLFAAGFLHGYINKLSEKECLEIGTEMSSKVIQQIGARL